MCSRTRMLSYNARTALQHQYFCPVHNWNLRKDQSVSTLILTSRGSRASLSLLLDLIIMYNMHLDIFLNSIVSILLLSVVDLSTRAALQVMTPA